MNASSSADRRLTQSDINFCLSAALNISFIAVISCNAWFGPAGEAVARWWVAGLQTRELSKESTMVI